MIQPTPPAPPPVHPTAPGEQVFGLGVVAWVALLGADRVDLLGGAAPFLLTPFLALTPLLLASEGLRLAAFRARVAPPGQMAARYGALLLALLCVALASTLLGMDLSTSAKRSLHLVAISGGTLLMAMALIRRPWYPRALALGAELGLALALVFNVGEVLSFAFDGLSTLHLGGVTVALEPGQYAGIVPRLTGQVADPNRAGLLFLFYIFALFHGGRPGARRRAGLTLAVVFIVATLSRSVVLAGLFMGVAALVVKTRLRVSRRAVVTATLALMAVSGLALASPRARAYTARALAPLSSRWSFREGSTQEHTYLLRRGLEEGTLSVRRAALGLGYGNSFHTLQDVFPGNKYGNFHSLYVTLLAESGVLALLLALALMGYPLIRPGPFLPLVVGLWMFNSFYQAATEPTFWFILAMAWLTAAGRTREEPCPSVS